MWNWTRSTWNFLKMYWGLMKKLVTYSCRRTEEKQTHAKKYWISPGVKSVFCPTLTENLEEK